MQINIRKENKSDFKKVEELVRDSFWNLYVPGCDEHYLAHILRSHPDFITEMDFVVELDGKIIANIMYSKSFVIDENDHKTNTLTFGPVCVLPKYQHKGIGSKLINHTIEIAKKNSENAIIILGDPHNYCRYGFRNSRDYLISDAQGRYPYGQLVLELKEGIFDKKTKKKLHLSDVFNFEPSQVAEFDKTFPPKKKEFQYSQVEFSMALRAYLD